MSQEQTNGLSQLQKLQALQAQNKAKAKTSSMTKLENIVGVYLGTEPGEQFPKLLDANGNKIQEEKNGRKLDKRSETSDGWTYTFAEFNTCKKVQIVLEKRINLQLMTAYNLGGLGYDIKSGNMYFIEKDTTITNY